MMIASGPPNSASPALLFGNESRKVHTVRVGEGKGCRRVRVPGITESSRLGCLSRHVNQEDRVQVFAL